MQTTMAPKRKKQKQKVIGTVLRPTTRVVKETVEVAVFERDTQESTQEDRINKDTEEIDDEPVIKIIPVGQRVEIPVQEPQKDVELEKFQQQETEMAQVKEQEPEKDADKTAKSQEEETSEPEAKKRGRKTRSHEGKGQERDQRKRKRSRGKGEEGEENFRRYVFRVLKQVHPDLKISSMGMSIINSLMRDMFERIADEAAKLSQHTHKTKRHCRLRRFRMLLSLFCLVNLEGMPLLKVLKLLLITSLISQNDS